MSRTASKSENKDYMQLVRLTPSERRWLVAMAERERRTVPDMIRQIVAEAAERRGLLEGQKVTA